MLTLEETRLTLSFFKVFSILNILPIGVDVENGKIQRQSNGVKVFISRILYGVGVAHWLYVFGRLVQSTILEPEKYFRWDHFVLHFASTLGIAVFYFTGFRLFIKTPDENVIIFNQLFLQREDPVQKMMDQQLQTQMKKESRNGNQKQGNGKSIKSAAQLVSSSARESPEESQGQDEVMENQSESVSEVGRRPLLTWPLQYSLNELLAKLLPFCLVFNAFFSVLILAIDPSRPQLLYSSLPPEYQNVYSFVPLLAVETLCMCIPFFTGSFAIVTQVLFFGKCQLEFKRITLQLRNLQEIFQNCLLEIEIGSRDIRTTIWILRQILVEMRELVVFIELFNRCFPFCIFAWKIFSLSTCIMFYFFAVRHHEDFPVLAAFMGYGAIIITLVYTIMYANAFSLPEKMDELKNGFLLAAQKTVSASTLDAQVNKILRAEMKRELKRIQGVGVKVASFHQLERESTPNFIDFVFRNVVSLLVSFPR